MSRFSKIITNYIGSPISITVNTIVALILVCWGLHLHVKSEYWEETNTYYSVWAIITADIIIMMNKKMDKDNEKQMDTLESSVKSIEIKLDKLLSRKGEIDSEH